MHANFVKKPRYSFGYTYVFCLVSAQSNFANSSHIISSQSLSGNIVQVLKEGKVIEPKVIAADINEPQGIALYNGELLVFTNLFKTDDWIEASRIRRAALDASMGAAFQK